MKKIYIGSEELVKILVDKMLEKYNVNTDYVIANPTIDGISWFQYYTWTSEEQSTYKEWFIKFLKNNVKPKLNKERIEREFFWFDLMWGLKIANDENN